MLDKKIPNHVAIIPDGNRRWAKENGLPTIEGHRRGAVRFRDLAKASRERGIHTLTAWGFSTENWERDSKEVQYLMDLFIWLMRENHKDAHQDQVRVRHLGRKDRLPKKLLDEIEKLETETAGYTRYDFNICIDYGGQDEIIRAVNKLLKNRILADREKIKSSRQQATQTSNKDTSNHDLDNYAGNISIAEVSKEDFYSYLDTADQKYPNPDLLIRTSGEMRTSGLMPFQMPYAELYFESAYLPDFTVEKLNAALDSYSLRDRRFGGNTQK